MATISAIGQVARRPAVATAEAWKQLTVGAFFGGCRWSNAAVAAPALTPELPLSLGYQLTVGQFFGAVPWQGRAAGQPLLAEPPGATLPSELESDEMDTYELPELSDLEGGDSEESGEITLDDFLGSFG